MDDRVFPAVTAEFQPEVSVDGTNLIAAPRRDSRPKANDASNGGEAWASAMSFLGVHPYASAEDAPSGTQWLAERRNPQHYKASAIS